METKYESYWDLLEPAWDDLCTGLDEPGTWSALQQKHSPIVVNLFTTHFCQSEVCNGGWLQFFMNSTGVIGPETIKGFGAVGMPIIAAIASEAVLKLGQPYPRGREQRWDVLLAASTLSGDEIRSIFAKEKNHFIAYRKATLSLGLDALDTRFYASISSENGGFEQAATAYSNRTLQ